MRGVDSQPDGVFSYLDIEERIPKKHPLRTIRRLADSILNALSDDFNALYSPKGRPGIAPEKLLRALLLQAFFSIRSERQLIEQLNYNLLFRWFVGLGADDPVWNPTVFTKNRNRLLTADVSMRFLSELVRLPQVKSLLLQPHFSVDTTRIQAWEPSAKSLQPGALSQKGIKKEPSAKKSLQPKKREIEPSARSPQPKGYRKIGALS